MSTTHGRPVRAVLQVGGQLGLDLAGGHARPRRRRRPPGAGPARGRRPAGRGPRCRRPPAGRRRRRWRRCTAPVRPWCEQGSSVPTGSRRGPPRRRGPGPPLRRGGRPGARWRPRRRGRPAPRPRQPTQGLGEVVGAHAVGEGHRPSHRHQVVHIPPLGTRSPTGTHGGPPGPGRRATRTHRRRARLQSKAQTGRFTTVRSRADQSRRRRSDTRPGPNVGRPGRRGQRAGHPRPGPAPPCPNVGGPGRRGQRAGCFCGGDNPPPCVHGAVAGASTQGSAGPVAGVSGTATPGLPSPPCRGFWSPGSGQWVVGRSASRRRAWGRTSSTAAGTPPRRPGSPGCSARWPGRPRRPGRGRGGRGG